MSGPARRRRGFSLIELMVAIAIGGLLLAGAATLFINNRDTSRFTNELAHMQESARFAIDMMLRDIRMAGYFGCQNDVETMNSAVFVDTANGERGALWDATFAIEGFDTDVDASAWSPSGYAANIGGADLVGVAGEDGQILPGTDALVVRFLQGSHRDTTADAEDLPDAQVIAASTTSVEANKLVARDYLAGGIAGVSDCGGTDLFVIANGALADGDTLDVYDGPGPGADQLSREYSATNRPMLAPYVARRYYVGRNSRGRPALFRTTISGVDNDYEELPQELFEGVENLQILYGVDRDGDGAPDVFLQAGEDAGAVSEDDDLDLDDEWRSVVAVKIALLLRSANEHQAGKPGGLQHALLDVTVDEPDDLFRRRAFTTMVVLRNLQ